MKKGKYTDVNEWRKDFASGFALFMLKYRYPTWKEYLKQSEQKPLKPKSK